MVYQFHDVDTVADHGLESSNKLIYNGTNVDNALTNEDVSLITLNINGRGIMAYRNNITEAPGLDGGLYESSFLESRTLEVEMQIEAVDTNTFIRTFEKMNKLFRTAGEVPIQFSDEPDVTYYGRYISSNHPKEDSNVQVFTITMVCSDPFKEIAEQAIDYTNADSLTVNSDFPVKPHIAITFPENTHEFKVHNTSQFLTIDYKRTDGFNTRSYNLKVNENAITRSADTRDGYSGLVLSTDWEDFTIETGDQIVVQPEPESIKIYYKGEKL